jgi:hypothetical protein
MGRGQSQLQDRLGNAGQVCVQEKKKCWGVERVLKASLIIVKRVVNFSGLEFSEGFGLLDC